MRDVRGDVGRRAGRRRLLRDALADRQQHLRRHMLLLLLLLLQLLVAVVVDVVDVVDDLEALTNRQVFNWRFLSDLMLLLLLQLLLLLLLRSRKLRRDGHDVVVRALQNRFDRVVAVGLLRGQVQVLLDEVRRGRPVTERILPDEKK